MYQQLMPEPGTAQRCDCHGDETLAVMRPSTQSVDIRDRRHGTTHMLSLDLRQIVRVLDPAGTTARILR